MSGLRPKRKSTLFVVETHTLADGWVNCWHVDGLQQTFDSFEEAQEDLDEFFEDVEAAGMDYSRDDYRIRKVR
jgi:hypothetical protein